MAGRRTNLALLFLLAASFATGVVAYGIGTGWGRWAVVAHGCVAFGIVVLAPWKSVVARRGLRRRRPDTGTSLAFTALIVIALLSGVLHATGIARSFGVVTAMQLHVGAALLAIPLAVRHVIARRVRLHRTDLSRRQALRAGAIIGGAGLIYGAVEGIVRVTSLPGARRRFTGSYETGSFSPEDMPVTQWLNDRVPVIDIGTWRLDVRELEGARSWTYDELLAFADGVTTVLDCTGGWFATQRWTGARLSRLIATTAGARSITVTSVTGYRRRFPTDAADVLLLATAVGDEMLSPGHGWPARLVAPGRRGFWWV
ncbi:MAG: molybdopterin-dependent oxidoreductase, partial [Actinomycetota bacterium]|nr:molybdopterin-dependent oxidoreductase [Actinomycetota bacterium]